MNSMQIPWLRPKTTALQRQLAEPWRYRRQLQKLQIKNEAGGRLYRLRQDEVSLGAMLMDLNRFSRILAQTVAEGSYRLEPAKSRFITVNHKQRELFSFRPTDLVVHGVVAELILERMRDQFSPCLFSYLKGRNWWHGISGFAEYVRKHRQGRPDPRQRGLYVMRRDIKKYTDTIPVGEKSPLWQQLRDILEVTDSDTPRWGLIQEVVRPEVIPEDGRGTFSKCLGVPTGSPISTTLFNTYLHRVDGLLDGVEGAFYARYADDLIFAHPQADVVRAAARTLDTQLATLRLSANQEKGQDLFFNGAGRPPPVKSWRGARTVRFLGCHVGFDGTVSLTPGKLRDLLQDLEDRTSSIGMPESGEHLDERASLACEIINQALDPASGRPHKTAALLSHAVTDREQLWNIDYRVALLAAQIISGQTGPRAFRQVGYHDLRAKWGLVSLFHRRNKGATAS